VSIFNISLDDACSHPKANPFPEVIGWCDKLIKRWPDIKIDFFTSAAYARLNEEPYFLSQHPEWVKQANALPQKNYRFNCHSYYHRRLSVKYGNSNNNEVEKTDEKETRLLIGHMLKEFDATGLKYSKVFRAPGFHIGVPAARVLTEMGFKIAGNQKYFDQLNGRVKNLRYGGIYNWDLNKECNITVGDVMACGHTSNWTTNYFCEPVYNMVVKLLESREFEFKFLDEII
jgi:hypothetical protein